MGMVRIGWLSSAPSAPPGRTLDVPVDQPAFWWRARARRINRWVRKNPDVVDRCEPRWDDNADQRWNLIAQAVADVGDELAARRWTAHPSEAFPDWGITTIADPGLLTETEQHIVRSWFSETVMFDPWVTEFIVNGRHRLWCTRKHFGRRLIPIKSEALVYTTPENREVLGPTWPDLYRDNWRELLTVYWLDRRDPLNARYVKALSDAGRGIPTPPC